MRFISLCQGECICILHWENWQVDDGKIKIETKNSIYEFDIDPTCVPKEVLPTLIANAQIYFDSKMETNVAGQ